ncbi:MAG: hypothetical protein CMA88_02925 [Euryarchaeota archaeon]|nr:hypothetical protein [Euryarchaeota archaeon]
MASKRNPTDLSPSQTALIEMQDDVRSHFGWEESDDLSSAHELLQRVEISSIETWARHNRAASLSRLYRRLVIREPNIAILGAAIEPSEVIRILESPTLIVAADGASGVLSELPQSLSELAWSRIACIVSDADGGHGTVTAVSRSVPIILHAHGDNREDWLSLVQKAESQTNPPDLVLTHQTSSKINGMHNPGGFTDGDRAACFLTALGVSLSSIRMLGTRADIVGRWSGSTDEPRKSEKLRWMERSLKIQGLWAD